MRFAEFLHKLTRRGAILAILVVAGIFLINHPNPVTHKCVPNFRTQMGLSSEGYPQDAPYTQHFCKTGYYPVLKYGQDGATTTRLEYLLFGVVPIGLISIAAYIIYAGRRSKS